MNTSSFSRDVSTALPLGTPVALPVMTAMNTDGMTSAPLNTLASIDPPHPTYTSLPLVTVLVGLLNMRPGYGFSLLNAMSSKMKVKMFCSGTPLRRRSW